jgi:hypothetical protein
VVSERLNSINLKNGLLHNESGPALDYRDGTEIWSLNGVRVPKEIVLASPDDIDPKIITKEPNAEIRREIVRKIGIERILTACNAVVSDSLGLYDLLLLDIGDNRKRPYLKMLNPSTETWHIEGVPIECQTVEQALAWRNGLDKYSEPVWLS